MKRMISSLLFGAALLSPLALMADDSHGRNGQEQRYYDRNAKDYHTWNDGEDRAWRQYTTEHHKKYRNFKRASKRDQTDFFKWRHDHPDHDNR